MLELLRQFCSRAGKGLEFIFDSSFEAVCLFALFGIVVSVLLLHLHVRLSIAREHECCAFFGSLQSSPSSN